MNRKDLMDWINMDNLNAENVLEEKFDNAIIGNDCEKIIYDISKMEAILKEEGMGEEDIDEYLEKNCFKKFENKVIFMFPYNKEIVDSHLFVLNLFGRKDK